MFFMCILSDTAQSWAVSGLKKGKVDQNVVVHVYNLSTQEAEAGELWIQAQTGPQIWKYHKFN
jgi:hypothetical protein